MALALGMGAGSANAVDMNSATFTMLDAGGGGVGLDPTVTGSIGGGAWAVASTTTFFGLIWTAHDGTTFGPGTYSFNTADDGVSGPTYTGVVVGSGQVGGHILFDWGITTNIDVINVWDISDNGDGTVTYTSTDATAAASVPIHPAPASATSPDGILGIGMIDGAFPQFHASFDFITSAPPVANDDSRGTTVDTLVNIVLVTNDSAAAAADSAASSPAAVPPAVINLPSLTTTQGGTLVDRLDGSVDYTPAAAFVGSDDFQYTLTDESGRVSGAATVTITVSAAANTPPVANDATVNTDEEVSVQINVDSVATDADGDSLTFATFDAVTAQGGTVTVDGTNTILTYSPAADFNGTDTFTYSVTDNIDSSNTATITIIVNPINDPLVCTDVTLATGLDTPLAVSVANDLLSTCSDPDAGDTISLASTTQPNQPGSTLADDGAGTLTYTPATGFEGQDSFTYTATDGTVFDTRTVFIDVSGKIFGNFTMLDGDGVTFGGTNDIVFTWDNTCYNSVAEADAGPENMVMGSDSSFPFFGFPWFAHDIKVYCPGGPYTVDSCNAGVTPPDCGPLTFTVPADHLGGHILFDWNVTADIDVAIVWNNSTGGTWQNVVPTGQLYQGPAGPTPALDEFYEWISVDADGDGIPGIQFVDGPFINFRANFNFKTTASGGGEVEIPVSTVPSPNLGSTCSISKTPRNVLNGGDWLVLSAFITWLGIGVNRRRHQKMR